MSNFNFLERTSMNKAITNAIISTYENSIPPLNPMRRENALEDASQALIFALTSLDLSGFRECESLFFNNQNLKNSKSELEKMKNELGNDQFLSLLIEFLVKQYVKFNPNEKQNDVKKKLFFCIDKPDEVDNSKFLRKVTSSVVLTTVPVYSKDRLDRILSRTCEQLLSY